MKIKSLVVIAVLATAVLCSAGFVKAQSATTTNCLSYAATADQITCLTNLITQLAAELAQLQLQAQSQSQAPQQTSPQPQSTSCGTLNVYLTYGSTDATTNGQVTQLQTDLTAAGYDISEDNPGEYGLATISAVKQFQASYNIRQTGAVGPITRAKLNSLYDCNATPASTQPPITTPSQNCSSDSDCASGQTCDNGTCATAQTQPTTICISNWLCPIWNPCVDNQQTRTCTDINNCGVTADTSLTSRACTTQAPTAPQGIQPLSLSYTTGINRPDNSTQQFNISVNFDSTKINPAKVLIYVNYVDGVTGNAGGNPGETPSIITQCDAYGGGSTNCNGKYVGYLQLNNSTVEQQAIKVSVKAFDANGFVIGSSDVAGGTPNFSITLQPLLVSTGKITSLVTPSGGEALKWGQTFDIKWTSSGFTNQYISFDLYDYTDLYHPVSANGFAHLDSPVLASAGAYHWFVPNFTGSKFQIRACAQDPASGNVNCTPFSNYFSISNGSPNTTPPPTTPTPSTFTFTYPAGGEHLFSDTAYTIKWTSTGASNSSIVKLALLNSSGAQVYINDVLNTGSYLFLWPPSIPKIGQYKFEIIDPGNLNATFVGNLFDVAPWTACNPNWQCTAWSACLYNQQTRTCTDSNNCGVTNPNLTQSCGQQALTLTSPNGGEQWTMGSTHNITWQANGYTGNVGIELQNYTNGSTYMISTTAPASAGSYSFTVSSASLMSTGIDLPAGNQYKMDIFPIINYSAGPQFVSNNYFSIVGATPASITVNSPSGGEVWDYGQTHDITWSSTGLDTVNIGLVKAGAQTSITIASNVTASLGKYTWTIPSTLSAGAYNISITHNFTTGGSGISASSNAPFHIGPFVKVTSPVGGEVWWFNSPYTIMWQSKGTTNVNIFLVSSSGTQCQIGQNIPASAGSKTFTIYANQQCLNVPFMLQNGQYKVTIVGDNSNIIDSTDYIILQGMVGAIDKNSQIASLYDAVKIIAQQVQDLLGH